MRKLPLLSIFFTPIWKSIVQQLKDLERYVFFYGKLIFSCMWEKEMVDGGEQERESIHRSVLPDAGEITDLVLQVTNDHDNKSTLYP